MCIRDRSGNALVALPDGFGDALENLEVLHLGGPAGDASCNRLADVPAALGRLARLRDLALHDNALTSLPPLHGCASLATLRLDRNPLRALPELPPTLTALHLQGCPLPGGSEELDALPAQVLALGPQLADLQLPDGHHVGSFFGTPLAPRN